MRDITTETEKVQTGKGPAASSYKADWFHLISPRLMRRLAKRLTVGGQKYGSVQWRQGINDAEYVTDRFNHFFDHLLKFMEDGNTKDDNLGAMIWGLHALVEVEELTPAALSKIIGTCKLFGEEATKVHDQEMLERNPVQYMELGQGLAQVVTREDYQKAKTECQQGSASKDFPTGLLSYFRRN